MVQGLIDNRYELLDVIASGGMATVWRARDTRLDRMVAIKRPHPGAPDDPGMKRLEREARVAASLSHPNLVTIYDSGRDETGPYMVMELVEGSPLTTAAASMDGPALVAVGAQIADALAAVHAAGIVHRDVKPSNVMMSERGALLTDFGIARTTSEDRVTETGELLATPSYAAPEVLAGGEPSPAADVYSLALLLYELIGGRLAFSTSDRTAPPPPLADQHIDAVLRPALAIEPDLRPSAGALSVALRGSAPTRGMASPTSSGEATAVMEPVVPPPASAPTPPLNSSRDTPVLLTMSVLALVGLAAMAMWANRGADAPTAVVPTTTTATTRPTTAGPTTTTGVTTPTTTGPTTTGPPTTGESSTGVVTAARDRFAEILNDVRPSQLKPKDRREMISKVDEAIAKADAGDTEKASDQLKGVVKKVDDRLENDARDQALEALDQLADALGLTLENDD